MACSNRQCVSPSSWCDGHQHCRDLSDEIGCDFQASISLEVISPPALVEFGVHGIVTKTPLKNNEGCPDTHVLCAEFYCLPVYVLCNQVYDCPDWQDEVHCDSYRCAGFYRCRHSAVCLHPTHLCDDVFQCPRHDDELLCDFSCPQSCGCQGLSAVCSDFVPKLYPHLRYIDATASQMNARHFEFNTYLIVLRLVNCRLKNADIPQLPNLQILDLSDNNLHFLQMGNFTKLNNLKQLRLTGNPIHSVSRFKPEYFQTNLQLLDLSKTEIDTFDSKAFSSFKNIKVLNLSWSHVQSLSKEEFGLLSSLQVLDLRRAPLETFSSNVFKGLKQLSRVYTDNYKLCCRATLPPHFPPRHCLAPSNEISSCEDLLRSNVYRLCLWLFAAMATAGNITSIVFKLWFQKDKKASGFSVFVIHLSFSDLLMGIYLVLIGAADIRYRGQYLWFDLSWKQSAVCKVAGFLSFLSAEMSAFLVFLITVDRFIVFRFPFSDVRFHRKSASMVSVLVWLTGVTLAGIPLLPVTAHWEYYSQTGICIPLPITRHEFEGRVFSFSVMIVMNLVVFLLIATGQMFIYWSIYTNTMSSTNGVQSVTRKNQDTVIVRRLSAVVISDFLCWFPIGLLGVLASLGVPVPGWLNVAVAILVLPINSAVNPFLYTFSLLMETRRKLRAAHRDTTLHWMAAQFKEQPQ